MILVALLIKDALDHHPFVEVTWLSQSLHLD